MITLSNKSNAATMEPAVSLLSTPCNAESNSISSLLSNNDGGVGDAFGGKDLFGTPDFSNLNASFFATIGQAETAGSVACAAETAGSVAFSGAETAGSVACGSVGGGDCGGSCGGGGFSSVG